MSVTTIIMKTLVVFACLLVASQGASLSAIQRFARLRPIFPNGKIVGGSAVDIADVPWQVALEDGGYLFCGGSIISANYVLTAAHCTDGNSARNMKVRAGTSKLQSGGQTIQVASIAQNPGFTQKNLDYDVSVLQLSSPLSLGTAKAVTLSSQEASAGQTAQVSGWGTLTSGGTTLPSNLQAVKIPIVARSTCNSNYGGDITARMICAGEAGRDSCQGDSGGAITINNVQVGIVSWGIGCAQKGYPGVYSNVPALKSYIDQHSNNEAKWS